MKGYMKSPADPPFKPCKHCGAELNANWTIRGLQKRIAELEGRTVNGIVLETWPPNRRTPEDSNAKAIALMRQHVASYKSIDAHRHNCLDLCRRIELLEEELSHEEQRASVLEKALRKEIQYGGNRNEL